MPSLPYGISHDEAKSIIEAAVRDRGLSLDATAQTLVSALAEGVARAFSANSEAIGRQISRRIEEQINELKRAKH
jgi:hypothetical protein